MPPGGVPPTSGTVAGDVDADLHDELTLDERDVQGLAGAPPGGERPARPGVTGPGRGEQRAEGPAGGLGERGAAPDVAQAPVGVVPA